MHILSCTILAALAAGTLMPLRQASAQVHPHLEMPVLTLDLEAVDTSPVTQVRQRVRNALLDITESIRRAANERRMISPPATTVRLWSVSPGNFALEIGGGRALGVRPQFVAIGGGANLAYMGSLRIGEVAIFQGYVDVTDGMRFYGIHDFNLAYVRFAQRLRLVFVFREGVRAQVHPVAGTNGSLEPQFGAAMEIPTVRQEGETLEAIQFGIFAGGAVALSIPHDERTRVAGGYSATASVQLIW